VVLLGLVEDEPASVPDFLGSASPVVVWGFVEDEPVSDSDLLGLASPEVLFRLDGVLLLPPDPVSDCLTLPEGSASVEVVFGLDGDAPLSPSSGLLPAFSKTS
jgi:hypothetical protein